MEVKIHIAQCAGLARSNFEEKLRFAIVLFQIVLILGSNHFALAKHVEHQLEWQGREGERINSHSCIHDQIIEERKRPGRQVYSVSPQVYKESDHSKEPKHTGRSLLGYSESAELSNEAKKPIRIYLNYDAVGHSPDRDCHNVGDIVKLGEPPMTANSGSPLCNPQSDPPVYGDCWYNCTLDDISREDKRHRLRKALGQTADWFKRALAVEHVRGNLRLSGYSACGQDGGVQLPREYVEEGVANADLVLLVTTRPTTGNTLAWAVTCERDQWGRAIAGHVNVAPRHLTAEAETLLSATLIHEVMHVLGFDPHAFSHFRNERKRRRSQVTRQAMDEKLGRMVTRVVLPRVIMHARNHYGAFSENFTGLELEDGGGRGTSGSHWEKRLLMNEIMTGSVDTRSVVSTMTLALLEDSGWYKANYSMAERLDWGRNQGTNFVTSPCNQWKGAYYCNNTQLSGCTFNREAEGYCPVVSYSGDLPHWARYFPQANKDTNSARMPDRMLGEVRGSSSRCMTSSLVRIGFVRGSMTQGNGCYQHRCVNNTLQMVSGKYALKPVDQFSFSVSMVIWSALLTMNYAAHPFFLFLDYVPILAISMATVPVLAIVVRMENALKTEFVNVTMDIPASIAPHLFVTSNAASMVECSDYAGYTCQNSSKLLSSLSVCKDVLESDLSGQHCAPSEPSILQQLEEVVVMPNYHRLFPGGPRKLLSFFGNSYCDVAAKRLACWISIQKCDRDGDNRLRVCQSSCQSYNLACGASLDCSDQTLFSSEEEGGQCTGATEMKLSWFNRFRGGLYRRSKPYDV
ncbi:hypothetical protein V2J09_011731 [Rumex salicifolius]